MHLHYKVNRKPTRNERERKLCIYCSSYNFLPSIADCTEPNTNDTRKIYGLHSNDLFAASIRSTQLTGYILATQPNDGKKNSNSLPILKTIDSSIVWQARDSITHLPCPFHNEWMNSRWLECLIFRKKINTESNRRVAAVSLGHSRMVQCVGNASFDYTKNEERQMSIS